MTPPTAVIFDLGNVLVDWSPQAFFVENGYSPGEAEALLAGPVSLEWHSRSDAGLSIAENVRQRILDHPEHARALTLYRDRWHETILGSIVGTVALLERLAETGVPLYALTNFPADMYPAFFERFAFMKIFCDVIVSGEIGIKKPDPRIFALAVDRFEVTPGQTLFIDDRLENCEAAGALGFRWHHFMSAEGLQEDLVARSLL